MTIEVLSDVIMDECVFVANAGGRRMRQNDRTINQGGFATVNAVRDVTLLQYSLGVKPMGVMIDWKEVVAVYEVTDAGTYGFLIKDPVDQIVDFTDGVLQGYTLGAEFGDEGFGNGGPLYALRKKYKPTSTTRTKSRIITRPNGTPSILRGGTPVVPGGSAGQVGFSAGPVFATFVADQVRAIDSITVGSTTVVNLASAMTGLVVGGRLWLEGVTGSDAALLNSQSHEIGAIAGDDYTLLVNTAGKAITASGSAFKYPQPDEALVWSGEFYVPVHFASDDMDWDLVLPGEFEDRLVQGLSITLMEVREA